MEINKIQINKNRGWRGLAEMICYNTTESILPIQTHSTIFSFSQPVWDDMQRGIIVMHYDEDNYAILRIDNTEKLPKGQRSVLIKDFGANVLETIVVPKVNWINTTRGTAYYEYLYNFNKNSNKHTTSDWNCIGIRVVPMI